MKILFVDDNELNRSVMQEMLSILIEDAEIHIFESAEDVLAYEDILSFDIILSDIDMPVIDGYTLYDRLRKEENFTKPIIAVTALAVKGDREKILMYGFTDYISKPIDMTLLEEILHKYI